MSVIDNLRIWEANKYKLDDRQRAMVRELVENADVLLDRVIETFPTYTLHNHTHAENVAELMADLLGDDISKLTGIETVILILSAFYHDIGMVFSENDRANLEYEDGWEDFLDRYSEAYVKVQESGEIPVDVAEWYCRSLHPERVDRFLDPDKIIWNGICFKNKLALVCKSHNLPTEALNDKEFQIDFLIDGDLRFCAVLLRLADILDFDNSRSPDAVYQFLGLSSRKDNRTSASDVEWRKHLASTGFSFPNTRPASYALDFIAGPDEPAVEHDVREFLIVIENELSKCDVILRTCADKWRNFVLPRRVNRHNIKSQGYKYGDYRFTLEQQQIFDLLMGENLYSEPFTFVREILQNAIDTSRYRRIVEHSSGNLNFEPQPIIITDWRDEKGSHWVRFDDYGMGMDENIIVNHLLKVGSSFYTSSQFQADVLRLANDSGSEFLPISRFGIGLLSCFISGDTVEISTCPRAKTPSRKDDPIRLSITSSQGFYVFQTPKETDRPKPMPSQYGDEESYRPDYGTSVAVRLDPRKEQSSFNIRQLIDRYLLCPPVVVEYEGVRMGGDPAVVIDKPWCKPVSLHLSHDDMQAIEKEYKLSLNQPLSLQIIPLDLTMYSLNNDLNGQIVAAFIEPTEEWHKLNEPRKYGPTHHDSWNFIWSLVRKRVIAKLPEEVRAILGTEIGGEYSMYSNSRCLLAHNGIKVPVSKPSEPDDYEEHYVDLSLVDRLFTDARGSSWIRGIISFADTLRPNVSLSRELLFNIPWNICSSTGLAISRAIRSHGDAIGYHEFDLMPEYFLQAQDIHYGNLLRDELLFSEDGWTNEPIVRTKMGSMTVDRIRTLLKKENEIELLDLPSHWDFDLPARVVRICAQVLIQSSLDVRIVYSSDRSFRLVAVEGSPRPVREGQHFFPPLFFVPFEYSSKLISLSNNDEELADGSPINQDHPFSVWLIDMAPEIYVKFPGTLEIIRNQLIRIAKNWDMAVIEDINTMINRIRKLDRDIGPPPNVRLKIEDFDFFAD